MSWSETSDFAKCEQCGTEVFQPFTCSSCGRKLCFEHMLPESHRCLSQPKTLTPSAAPSAQISNGPEPVVKQRVKEKSPVHVASPAAVSDPPKASVKQPERKKIPAILSPVVQAPIAQKKVVKPPVELEKLAAPVPTLVKVPIVQEDSAKPRSVLVKVRVSCRKLPVYKLVVFATVALVLIAAVWVTPRLMSNMSWFSLSGNPSVAPSEEDIATFDTSATAPDSPTEYSYETLVCYALELINLDRQASGFQPVSLSTADSGQRHADEMLKNHYFSHWDTNGWKPCMRYTFSGGQGAVQENIAFTSGKFNVKEEIKKHEHNMMYDDAGSNWGHRDIILDPFHNRVSIGIAYDDDDFYFVQDFESCYVLWSTLFLSDQVRMQGTILKSNLSISHVAIHFDSVAPLTSQQLSGAPHNGVCGQGKYVGSVGPSGLKDAAGGMTIIAESWSKMGQTFDLAFDISPAFAQYGRGVYTLYLWTDSENCLTSLSVWN